MSPGHPGMDNSGNRWIIPFIVLSSLPVAMRKLRTALICMLMVALPIQAMAALGMQLCAVTAQDQPSSQLMAAHHPGALMHDQHALGSHGSHHSGGNAQPASVADTSLCSLCAFCVGAVALSSAVPSQPPLQSSEPGLPRLTRFVAFVAETPERPPRIFLA